MQAGVGLRCSGRALAQPAQQGPRGHAFRTDAPTSTTTLVPLHLGQRGVRYAQRRNTTAFPGV
jgi:hypothetical protein